MAATLYQTGLPIPFPQDGPNAASAWDKTTRILHPLLHPPPYLPQASTHNPSAKLRPPATKPEKTVPDRSADYTHPAPAQSPHLRSPGTQMAFLRRSPGFLPAPESSRSPASSPWENRGHAMKPGALSPHSLRSAARPDAPHPPVDSCPAPASTRPLPCICPDTAHRKKLPCSPYVLSKTNFPVRVT